MRKEPSIDGSFPPLASVEEALRRGDRLRVPAVLLALRPALRAKLLVFLALLRRQNVHDLGAELMASRPVGLAAARMRLPVGLVQLLDLRHLLRREAELAHRIFAPHAAMHTMGLSLCLHAALLPLPRGIRNGACLLREGAHRERHGCRKGRWDKDVSEDVQD